LDDGSIIDETGFLGVVLGPGSIRFDYIFIIIIYLDEEEVEEEEEEGGHTYIK
jgi:hypothetical protein